MSNLLPDQFLPLGLARVEQLRDHLNKGDDNFIHDTDGHSIMYFHTAENVEMIVRDWGPRIGVRHFHPIGNMCCGDWVCVHPSGILFVVDHDSLEWWNSSVSFEDLLRRLEQRDPKLRDDLYTPQGTA